jgi:hypothetical protein
VFSAGTQPVEVRSEAVEVVGRNKPDRTNENHMPFYSIHTENNLAVHPDKDAGLRETGAIGVAFAAEPEFSEPAIGRRRFVPC